MSPEQTGPADSEPNQAAHHQENCVHIYLSPRGLLARASIDGALAPFRLSRLVRMVMSAPVFPPSCNSVPLGILFRRAGYDQRRLCAESQ